MPHPCRSIALCIALAIALLARQPAVSSASEPSAGPPIGPGQLVSDLVEATGGRVADVELAPLGSADLVIRQGDGEVVIPREPEDGIRFERGDGHQLTVGLPSAKDASPAAHEGPGVVSYENHDGSSTVPVAHDDGSVAVHTVIDGRAAPERYSYRIGSAEAARVVGTQDGGAKVIVGERLTLMIAAPWAIDAEGDAVPTHYEIEGMSLVQVVDHRASGVAYPVVADPFWSKAWKVMKCAATVTAIIGSSYLGLKAIRALGGFVKVARLLVSAGGATARLKGALGVAGWILGVDVVKSACF